MQGLAITLEGTPQLLTPCPVAFIQQVRLSELSVLKKQAPLKALMQRAMDEGIRLLAARLEWRIHRISHAHASAPTTPSAGLEGLVMKACDGVYEPGKRHWYNQISLSCRGVTRFSANMCVCMSLNASGSR